MRRADCAVENAAHMLTAMAHVRKKVAQKYVPLRKPDVPITRENAPEVMRLFEVASLLRIGSRRGLDYLRKEPGFPRGFRYKETSDKTTSPLYWRRADIFAWIDARAKRARQGGVSKT